MTAPVIHFIDTTGPGGAETVFLQVASGLQHRGWPAVGVLTGPGWVLERATELGLEVQISRTRGRIDIRYLFRLVALVRSRGIRLIHAHLFSPAVYASLASVATGVPVVTTFHGWSDAAGAGAGMLLRRQLVQRRSRIIAVSAALRLALADAGFAAGRLAVIPNGVRVADFEEAEGRDVRREMNVPEDAVLVGAVGNVRSAKDYGTFLQAAALLSADPRYRFAIAGQRTEPLYGELVRLRDELGLGDRLQFWGFRDDIAAVLAAYDTLVISSSSEGFSIAAIQAMAAGTPVVATRSGGPEQILTHEVDGLLVETGDPPALADAVRRMTADRALRDRLAGEAKRSVASRFSVERMLDAYEAVYRELLRPDQPAR